MFRSADAGGSWAALNDGLEVTQFNPGISLHPWNPRTLVAGTQDRGVFRYDGATWTFLFGGHGGYTAIDQYNPSVTYAESQWTTGGTLNGPRRADGGGFVMARNGIDASERAVDIPPLVMHPTDSRTLYFGTNQLYRTVDAAASWTAIGPPFVSVISAIAASAGDPGLLYVAAPSQVFVSRDAATWTVSNGLPTRYITDLAVDRTDPATAYVTFSGFGVGHVYRTTNGGGSWTSVNANLPDVPVNSVALDPANRAFVMVGTDLGVFASADSGQTWHALDDGMPNVAVMDIAYNPNTGTLVAGTYGRGMFQLQLNRALTLAVAPHRRANARETATTQITDSAAVIFSGAGAVHAAWSATNTAATWLRLTTSSGTGSGPVRYIRDPTGLPPGYHVDTITVFAAGATNSPARVIDTLFVEPIAAELSITPPTRQTTVVAGVGTAPSDSAMLLMPGTAGGQTAWTAVALGDTWLTVATPNGRGPGWVRWDRTVADLTVGQHVDTIVVTAVGASGSPKRVVDSLVVRPRLTVARPLGRDTLVSGSTYPVVVATHLVSVADPDATVRWTVQHGAARWLLLETTSGRGTDTLRWSKSASNLRDGIFVDTITVSAPGADPLRIIDTLVVVPPAVTTECVAEHALGALCLDAGQLRWLDLAGNNDGTYNLGDLLAYLARSGNSRVQTRRDE